MTVRNRRSVGQTSAQDLLPTHDAVAAIKRMAAEACCGLAARRAWPDVEDAKALLDLIPFVALDALAQLCPEVRRERLARCLGLDPLDGVDELARRREGAGWPADAVEAVLAAIGAAR